MPVIVKYKLSGDKQGLLAVLRTGEFYHIHADEMSDLEQWIHKLLRQEDCDCDDCRPDMYKLEKEGRE